ncbi:fungal-specific transcription factor domain-containing protein [Mycena galopus ATCC 62051]|nr:fungal-specific transcription factor domain-containing protein [Mycena galopus ATCC 62051]
MSDDEQQDSRTHSPIGSLPIRQRRPLRSCDICRQRKIQGDGQNMPNGHCSSCLAFGSSCTYSEPAKKRGRKPNLVDDLKNENVALKRENASLNARLRSLSVCSLCAQPLREPSRSASVFRDNQDHNAVESDSDRPLDELASRFSQFDLTDSEWKPNYFGSASSFALADHAIAMKETHDGRPFMLSRRPIFWDVLPWEKEVYAAQPQYVYPPRDLIESLLHLYFTFVHPTHPILHRPSFERAVAEGLHLTHTPFGGTLLALLAVASRYSKDSRVLVDDVDSDASLSAGWKFASQIWIVRRLFDPTIYDVQMYCLLIIYSCGTSVPENSWLYLGIGIRALHHRGVHRRKPEGPKWSPEDELWKRAFWSFVALDRTVCSFVGRPISLHIEEYDIDPPLDVDDEYWDQGFQQPPEKPSQLSYFLCDIRLCEIWGDAMRRLYGSKKFKMLMGWDSSDKEQHTVAEFDSAMNDFLDSIPPHLRWNPESPPQGVFFDQSAVLHLTYNYILIVIHRPYIHKVTSLAAASLSICANAARTILRTANIWLRKLQRIPSHNVINPVFVSTLILALNMLATKQAGLSADKNKDIALVAMAMEILKVAESRLPPVGRLTDLLREVWALEGHFPKENPPNANGDEAESSSLESNPNENFPQFGPSFESAVTTVDTSGQSPHLKPGMSIEQLLAATGAPDTTRSVFADEIMSMWMSVPTDISGWNGADANWFGAPQ